MTVRVLFTTAMLTATLTIGTGALADTVLLANGDRISGTVDTIAGGNVTVTTGYMGAVVIPMASVSSIDKTDDIRLTTADGLELKGTLTTVDGNQMITTSSGSRALSLANVTDGIDDFLAQKATEPTWTTNADLGYILTRGNSQTESRSIHLDSNAKHGKYEHVGFAYWNTDEAEEETVRNTLDAGYDLRYHFREKWYALASLGYFKDELKEVDSRYTVGLGLGHEFFDNERARLTTDLGVTWVFEDLAGESESNPALRWGLDYFRWLQADRIEYFWAHEVLKILDSDRGEVYKANTGLRFHMSDRWHANARVDLVHETDPPADNHRSDITYSVGFGFNF